MQTRTVNTGGLRTVVAAFDEGDEAAGPGHVVLDRGDGSTCGGHLLEVEVWPTLEVVLTEVPAELQKAHDPQTSPALLDLVDGSA